MRRIGLSHEQQSGANKGRIRWVREGASIWRIQLAWLSDLGPSSSHYHEPDASILLRAEALDRDMEMGVSNPAWNWTSLHPFLVPRHIQVAKPLTPLYAAPKRYNPFLIAADNPEGEFKLCVRRQSEAKVLVTPSGSQAPLSHDQ
jgi:hypothetical protein